MCNSVARTVVTFLARLMALAVCAVLGLASSASAETHYWRAAWMADPAPTLLWDGTLNWASRDWPPPQGYPTPAVPSAGSSVRMTVVGAPGDTSANPIIMNVDYSGGGLSWIRFTGGEDVYIQNKLKVTSTGNFAINLENGGDGGNNAYIRVDPTGSIDGQVNHVTNPGRPTPILDFAGGDFIQGDWRYKTDKRTIVRVSSASGSIRPNKIIAEDAAAGLDAGTFEFVLTATGVAPITLTQANPLDFQGTAAGTNPYNLKVNMASYTGGAASIPLFILNNADTDRMFASANITITGAPVAGAPWTVEQTDSGVTLTPTVTVTTGNYWAGSGGGGDGLWTPTGTTWSTSNTGSPAGAVQSTTGTLEFGATAGTVTIDSTVTVNNGLKFTTNNYQIAGASGKKLTLAGAAADNKITTNTNVTATINAEIAGTDGMIKDGEGRLVLKYANTYTGGTNVVLGTLELQNANALKAGESLTIGASGTVVLASDLTGAAAVNAGSSVAPVPEPGTVALLAAGLAGLLVAAWRRRRL